MDSIATINSYFETCFNNASTIKNAKTVADIDKSVSDVITKLIPQELKSLINNDNYKICGSVGKGRATNTPWIAMLDKDITTSTRNGVYVVFLFSTDLKQVYITLNQGTTIPGKFGPRLNNKRIEDNSKRIRSLLNESNPIFRDDGMADIHDKGYRKGAIYYTLWDVSSTNNKALLDLYLQVYEKYKSLSTGKHKSSDVIQQEPIEIKQMPFSKDIILDTIHSTGLIYSDNLIIRYAYALITKPFVILSGLAGSGKTQLAIALAHALSDNVEEQVCFVPVGADWTNREPLLGYPNALKSGIYEKPDNGILDIIIKANANPKLPYFLILDEMNLSYVERYFADFLSAMESNQEIPLWSKENGDVPTKIQLPKNLYITGTINVDETTYMFSPKVLDRANVIEFKVSAEEMNTYLSANPIVDINNASGKAACMAQAFVEHGKQIIASKLADKTLNKFFAQLKNVNAEFGYRSASEMKKFISLVLLDEAMKENEAIDAAIVQKILPKLHGSRKKLDKVLTELWKLCFEDDNAPDLKEDLVNFEARYPLSADKILRMYKYAHENGFTSYAEA